MKPADLDDYLVLQALSKRPVSLASLRMRTRLRNQRIRAALQRLRRRGDARRSTRAFSKSVHWRRS